MTADDVLRRLDDRQAIADLIARLGLMLDEKRFDEAPAILADDVAVRTPGGTARGRDAVVEQARRNHTVRTQHVITDVLVELDGDRAQACANLTVTFAPATDRPDSRLALGDDGRTAPHLTLGERYRFDAARGDAGWRLTAIEVTRLWSSERLLPGTRIAEVDAAA